MRHTFVLDEKLSTGRHVGDVDFKYISSRCIDEIVASPSAAAEHRLARTISASGPLDDDDARRKRDVIAAASRRRSWVRKLNDAERNTLVLGSAQRPRAGRGTSCLAAAVARHEAGEKTARWRVR